MDDEPGIRNALTLTLEKAGYRVEGFSDVDSVKSALDRTDPFLVILDVTLIKSDAIEAIQFLSNRNYAGAVLLLSGKSRTLLDEIQIIGQRRMLRMLPVMTKPCRMKAVRAVADDEAAFRSRPDAADFAPQQPARSPLAARPSVSLEAAIDEGRLEVWYQPKFDLRTGHLIGAESLSRVREPGGGIALPGSFIPGASDAVMKRLTEVVLRRALADSAEMGSAGAPFKLSVNIPCQLLTALPIAALLRDYVAADGWSGIVLEITEEDALRDIPGAHEAATQLRIYGIELSIDDFGLGYSSLSRLREIPFKEIKIDRSLVHGCASDKTQAAMCRAIVELAHTLGALVVAEGVELEADLDFVRLAGCDIVQGFLLGRPMPKADLLERIAAAAARPTIKSGAARKTPRQPDRLGQRPAA